MRIPQTKLFFHFNYNFCKPSTNKKAKQVLGFLFAEY